MVKSIEALHNEWKYTRSIVLCFLENVDDTNLQKKFPRKKLNTILEQCNELYEIQLDYVEAIKTKSMQFKERDLNANSAIELVNRMRELDAKLEICMEALDGEEYVNWSGEEMNIHQHLCAMISHEMMHVGQIIAFCYAVNITIPEKIIRKMSLDG